MGLSPWSEIPEGRSRLLVEARAIEDGEILATERRNIRVRFLQIHPENPTTLMMMTMVCPMQMN